MVLGALFGSMPLIALERCQHLLARRVEQFDSINTDSGQRYS